MPRDFRYPLTRICLRSGELTLPRTMLELFPRSGGVTAVDTVRDEEFALNVRGPRTVGGFAEFFRRHELEVNDTLLLRPLEDGRYAVTPVARPRRPDYRRPEAVEALIASVRDGPPRTEAEIRALHPGLPGDLDLAARLGADPRLELHAGRWRRAAPRHPASEPGSASAEPGPERSEGARRSGAPDGRAGRPAASTERSAPGAAAEAAAGPGAGSAPAPAPERAGGTEPEPFRPRRSGAPTVTPYPRGVLFPGDVALNSEADPGDLALQGRAREAFASFGFRVEGLPRNGLMVHAELGRHHYRALVHVLPDGDRLDWAALLARRRETGAAYLAVVGDHRDLHRLSAPADLARATLWSWAGIERARDLTRTVLIGPHDLEPHFERGGLFEHGLERFEAAVGKRVEERGVFSGVLARLAGLRAPSVFVLDDLVDAELTRERALRVIELLAQAPFHLVARVDHGEFCLRYPVPDAMLHLSEYALSLRDRLPNRRRERVLGLPDEAPAVAMPEARDGPEEPEGATVTAEPGVAAMRSGK